MTIKVKILPPLRDSFTMSAMEQHFTKEILNYFGNEVGAKLTHDDFVKQPVPRHEWGVAVSRARHLVYKDLLPSERTLMHETVGFE